MNGNDWVNLNVRQMWLSTQRPNFEIRLQMMENNKVGLDKEVIADHPGKVERVLSDWSPAVGVGARNSLQHRSGYPIFPMLVVAENAGVVEAPSQVFQEDLKQSFGHICKTDRYSCLKQPATVYYGLILSNIIIRAGYDIYKIKFKMVASNQER